jgi:hypothetical protein
MTRNARPFAAIVALTGLALAGCQQPTSPRAETAKAEAAKAEAEKAAPAAAALGAFSKVGTITKVEDSGYPMFTVTVDFGGGAVGDFLWNNEAANLVGAPNGARIETLTGNSATIAFTRREDMDAVSIKHNGKEVLDWPVDYGVPRPTPEVVIKGVLSGAADLTSSDLPDELSIKDDAGKVTTFEHFISERALVAANNKPVEIGFRKGIREEITTITMTPAAAKK